MAFRVTKGSPPLQPWRWLCGIPARYRLPNPVGETERLCVSGLIKRKIELHPVLEPIIELFVIMHECRRGSSLRSPTYNVVTKRMV